MVKSRFRKKLDRNVRNVIIYILLYPPFSFFTVSSFRRSLVIFQLKKPKIVTDELIFDHKALHWSVTEFDRFTKERVIIIEICKNDIAASYKHFIALLLKTNFFVAQADTHYSHYESTELPVTENTTEYEFILSWKWSGKLIYSVELIDNSNYGLSDEDRENFGIIEEFLKILTKG